MTTLREADLHVPPETIEAMGAGPLGGCFENATLRDVTVVMCGDSSAIVVNTVAEPIDDAFDAARAVERWERLDSDGGGATYLYEVVVPDRRKEAPSFRRGDLAIQSVTVADRGVTLTVTGSQEALQREIDSYEAIGAGVTLRRLTDYEGPTTDFDPLTPRQREVLETAYELGYYEVPRHTTADAVARRLDLDRSTVTEHLQRAERTLVTRLFSG